MIRAGLAHPHPGVRAAACEACIECYRRVGRRLERHLHGQKGVPASVVRSLKLAFMEIDQEALTRETDAAVAARWGAGGGDTGPGVGSGGPGALLPRSGVGAGTGLLALRHGDAFAGKGVEAAFRHRP